MKNKTIYIKTIGTNRDSFERSIKRKAINKLKIHIKEKSLPYTKLEYHGVDIDKTETIDDTYNIFYTKFKLK